MGRMNIERAVYNNAAWCEAVCRARGNPGEFLEGVWVNRHAAPRFYPNIVTLTRERVHEQLDAIRALKADLTGGWAVKDSYATLDLTGLGFRPLFEAQWIGREVSLGRPDAHLPATRWTRVTTEAQLARWERAWAGTPEADQPGIFMPALLADEDVAILAAVWQDRIVAGAIANRSGGVAGVSNLFLPAPDDARMRAACVAAAMDAFPGLPLAGYESGVDLLEMQAQGFATLGPLRVWVTA
jgi:hypothetical protein